MRAFVSIFLFLLLLSQTCSSFVMDGIYLLNKNYVAEALCINKANPQLHCKGKCYLSKQVEKEGKDNALPSAGKKDMGNEVYFFAAAEPVMQSVSPFAFLHYPDYITASLPGYHHSLLKPPRPFFV